MGDSECSFNDWQREAAEVLGKPRNDEVAFNVLQRTLEAAAIDMSLGKIPLDDPVGPRVEGILNGIDIEPQPGDQLALFELFEEPEDPRDIDYELRVQLPQEPMPNHEIASIMIGLDENFSFGIMPQFVKDELSEVYHCPDQMVALGYVLYQHFGDEALDLAFTFAIQGLYRDGDRPPEVREIFKMFMDNECTSEKKKLLFEKILPKLMPVIPDEMTPLVIKWALGEELYEKLQKDFPESADLLDKLKEIIQLKENFRRKLLRSLGDLRLLYDKNFASTFTRQGWRNLHEIDEVTDYEWWSIIKLQYEHLSKEPEAVAQVCKTDRQKKRFENTKGEIAEFFEQNEEPEEVRRLSDVIECKRFREELDKMDKEHNPVAYAAKQKEIAYRVFSAVTRFTTLGVDDESEAPTYEQGFPAHVSEHKNATCFSGPWLIAMLLFKCGIKYSDLLYCHVNQSHNNIIGGHGSILMKTKMREVIFIDHGFHMVGRELPIAISQTKEMAAEMLELLNGKRTKPVLFKVEKNIAQGLQVHQDMQIMPLSEGFNSGHLLHVGISFFEEERYEEAEYALELALSFSERDPDILYYLGQVRFRQDDLLNAEIYFEDAVDAFSNHLFSIYALGELALKKGDAKTAREKFKIVAETEAEIWKNDHYKKKAKELFEIEDDEVLLATINGEEESEEEVGS